MANPVRGGLQTEWANLLKKRAHVIGERPADSNPGEITHLFEQVSCLQCRDLSPEVQTTLLSVIENLNKAKSFYEERQALSSRSQKIREWQTKNRVGGDPEEPIPQLHGVEIQIDTFSEFEGPSLRAFVKLADWRREYAEWFLALNGLNYLWREIEQNRFLSRGERTSQFICQLTRNAAWVASPEAGQISQEQLISIETMLSRFPNFEKELFELPDSDFNMQCSCIHSKMSSIGSLNGAICLVQMRGDIFPLFLLFDGRQEEREVFYIGIEHLDMEQQIDGRAIVVTSPENLSQGLSSDDRFDSFDLKISALYLIKRKGQREPPSEEKWE